MVRTSESGSLPSYLHLICKLYFGVGCVQLQEVMKVFSHYDDVTDVNGLVLV